MSKPHLIERCIVREDFGRFEGDERRDDDVKGPAHVQVPPLKKFGDLVRTLESTPSPSRLSKRIAQSAREHIKQDHGKNVTGFQTSVISASWQENNTARQHQ